MQKRSLPPPTLNVREPAERHYTVAEVAEIYSVTPRTVRNWIADGSLRAWRHCRLIRIPASALDEFDAQS